VRILLPKRDILGFSLLELLVGVGILGTIASLLIPAAVSSRENSLRSTCMERMKNLSLGIQLYTQDHDGEFPRSSHSASTYRESGWTESVLPYMNISLPSSTEGWQQTVNQYHRCPSDRRHGPYDFSYGLNVCFELDPEGDDYLGSPTQWRKTIAIPKPSRTILLAELPETEGADHFMCHLWSNIRGASNAVASGRHKGRANYLFADGHIEAMALSQTFISRTNNLWNPSVAR